MKHKQKFIQLSEFTRVNEHGEISTSETTHVSYIESEPPFIKLYLDTILYLKDLPKCYNPVLASILKRMSFADGAQEVSLAIAVKKRISLETGLGIKRINKIIFDLVKGEILFRIDTALYSVNPHLFGRGEWKDIKKLRMQVDFTAEGTTIMTKLTKKSELTIQDFLDMEEQKAGSGRG